MATLDPIRFVKAEANGNDFLIVDQEHVPPLRRAELARRLCDRHRGIGADGVEFVRAAGDHLDLDLFNADGSPAEISGNGSRCVAAFYARHGFLKGELHTAAGTLQARVLDGGGAFWMIELEMGVPRLEGEVPLRIAGREFRAQVLSVGNPQCVIRVEDFPSDWEALGAAIESHPRFPQRTNVEFVRVRDRQHLDLRIFERGVGPTQSSGTGSSAAAVAAIAQGLATSPVEVITPGGTQRVDWAGAGNPVRLRGPATVLAEGVFLAP
ncbi:MAG: diaminopimelate epimerase [Terriglobales bacterium]